MKKTILILFLALASFGMKAQTQLPKVYNEKVDPIAQIDQAVAKAFIENKHVIVQLGGNWCIWCLRFADFISKDADIKSTIDKSYEYIHVNIPRPGYTSVRSCRTLTETSQQCRPIWISCIGCPKSLWQGAAHTGQQFPGVRQHV